MEIWNNQLCVVILSCNVPKYEKRAMHVKQICKQAGIWPVNVFLSEPNETKTILQNASATHYNGLRLALEQIPAHIDVFLLEDDAYFIDRNAADLILEYHAYLQRTKKSEWVIFTPGHCPLGPLIPYHKRLMRTPVPYAAHAYIMNSAKARLLISKHTAEAWVRPQFVEGWFGIPMKSKYAMVPPVVSQSILPRDLVNLLSLQDKSPSSLTPWLNGWYALILIYIPICIIIVIYHIFRKCSVK